MTDEMDNEPLNVKDFFAGRSIFITGGTGFLGKALLEKLLRSCPDLKEIFVLMRPKKGMSIDERLRKMFSSLLYEKVRETNPSVFEKVIPVKGDVMEEGLGLDSVDRQMLIDRVSVIFHIAASVRFDDNLRDAVFINTRSTRDTCILAQSMKKLVVLSHISSTYANSDKPVVEEIFYPSEVDWRKTITIAENIDVTLLKTLTSKYMGTVPNTYVFTKRLAECVINDYSDRLPCVILRPSVVIPSLEEPKPGWLDNFNGPVGLMIGGGKGVLRTVYLEPDTITDYIPVDVSIKAIILGTCKRGRMTMAKDPSLHVYNVSSYKFMNISMAQMISLALRINAKVPLDNCIWWPNTEITTCYYYFYINVLIFQLIPALILDQVLKFAGHKPMLARLQKSIFIGNVSLSFFMFNCWEFPNNKIIDLTTQLTGSDLDFYCNYFDFQLTSFFTNAILGAKIYLLHEDLSKMDAARKHVKRMWWVDRICKTFWFFFLVWTLFYYGFFNNLYNAIVI